MAVNIGDLIAGEEEIVLQNIQIPALKGEKGDTGRGISSVIKTSTVGLVDTWTITYTDGSTSSFDVTNGADGDDYVITSEDYQEIADIVLDNIEIPSKTSDLENDSGFIDNTVNDLQNYYKKSETYTKQEVDGKVSSVYKYKGSVATYQDLPSTSLTIGDVYNVESTGDNYAWTGTTWDKLGGDIDLSEYYTKTQVDSALENKVDKVTGKGLSTNDFTNADKTKLNSLENYDDTEVKSDIETLEESQASQDEKIAKLKADHPDIEEEGTDLSINGTGDFDLALSPKGNITQDGDPTPTNPVPVKVIDGEYEVTVANSDNTQSQTQTIDTSPNPLYSEDDLYFKAVNGDSFYDSLTNEQKANLESGKWYVHNEFIKIDMSDFIGFNHPSSWENETAFIADYAIKHGISGYTTIANIYCNRLIKKTPSNIANSSKNAIGLGDNNKIYFSIEGITTSADYVNYFQNNETYLYLPLATPTNTKITNTTLINSLEALQNMKSYQDQTNISQTHNEAQADMIINAQTIMSMRYLQNEIEELKQAILNS